MNRFSQKFFNNVAIKILKIKSCNRYFIWDLLRSLEVNRLEAQI